MTYVTLHRRTLDLDGIFWKSASEVKNLLLVFESKEGAPWSENFEG
jgi:hypothetical protein